MPFILSKTFRFEAAHRLAKKYTGKCASPHGHSWNGVIEVRCSDRLDENDMGVDFAVLGKYGKLIEGLFDHALLLHQDDKELADLCVRNNWKVMVFPENPTCETLAREIFKLVGEKLASDKLENVELLAIGISETCTTSCRYTGNA